MISPKKIVCFFCSAILLSVFLHGCVSTDGSEIRLKDGKRYGVTKGLFNQRWWSFLERGVSYSDGGFWPEAEGDIKEALKQRSRDQRRARTYGMHFVDYFPHRELGVVYFHTGRYAEAIDELQQSLYQEENAKAKYYLNKAREKQIAAKQLNNEPPSLSLSAMADHLVVNTTEFLLKGTALAENYVSAVVLNKRPLFIELAQKKIIFQQKIPLNPGTNLITLEATDLAGRSSTLTRQIVLDQNGPSFTITDIMKRADGSYFVSGFVDDKSAIASLTINGRQRTLQDGIKSIALEEAVSSGAFTLTAVDVAGNISHETIDLNDTDTLADSGWPKIMVRTAALGDVQLPDSSPAQAKGFKPLIDTKDLTDKQETFLDKILIEGRVRAGHAIDSITVNDIPLDLRPGKRVYFNQLATLNEGENIILITVKDSSGAVSNKKISIIRKIAKVHDIGSRLVLGVMPFSEISENGDLAELVFDFFQTKLVEKNRFHLVTREDLDRVLTELKLSQTKLVDPVTAARIGHLVVADNILAGKVFEKDGTIEVTVNTVDTETSKITASLDVYSESTDMRELQFLMEGLSLKLENKIPLLEGMIIKIKGSKYYLDLGKSTGLRAGMQIIAFREGEPIYHPITGKLLGADTEELGVLNIASVQDDYSVAKMRTVKGEEEIKELDKFITR